MDRLCSLLGKHEFSRYFLRLSFGLVPGIVSVSVNSDVNTKSLECLGYSSTYKLLLFPRHSVVSHGKHISNVYSPAEPPNMLNIYHSLLRSDASSPPFPLY